MFLNLPEIEMADKMCGGHRQVSQTVRYIYDMHRAGALRATSDGVTGDPILRVNITFSSTPDAARAFYNRVPAEGVSVLILSIFSKRSFRRFL